MEVLELGVNLLKLVTQTNTNFPSIGGGNITTAGITGGMTGFSGGLQIKPVNTGITGGNTGGFNLGGTTGGLNTGINTGNFNTMTNTPSFPPIHGNTNPIGIGGITGMNQTRPGLNINPVLLNKIEFWTDIYSNKLSCI